MDTTITLSKINKRFYTIYANVWGICDDCYWYNTPIGTAVTNVGERISSPLLNRERTVYTPVRILKAYRHGTLLIGE